MVKVDCKIESLSVIGPEGKSIDTALEDGCDFSQVNKKRKNLRTNIQSKFDDTP